MDRPTALDFADTLTGLVEARALLPADPQAYARAKETLYATVGPMAKVERAKLYADARRLLWTLDTDGHTILWSEGQMRSFTNATTPAQAEARETVRTITVDARRILVVQPPQTTFVDMEPSRQYAASLRSRIDAAVVSDQPCGVVIDLTESKGGNAWPALAVVGGLVSENNAARYVDRDGRRSIVFGRSAYERWSASLGSLPDNALERFAGTPYAVVIDGHTTSAGEMISVVLEGEANARTFGSPSAGATTSNVMTALPDRATLLLTVARYALGSAEPLRGRLQPDEAVPPGQAVASATAWVAGHAPACATTASR